MPSSGHDTANPPVLATCTGNVAILRVTGNFAPMENVRNTCMRAISVIALTMFPDKAAAEEPYFQSGFEDVSDFDNFYIVPITPESSTSHRLDPDVKFDGDFSYHAWIKHRNDDSTLLQNANHRAYPTVQFHKTDQGSLTTPVCVSINIWADFDLQDRPHGLEDQWISLATFTDDASDKWQRTVLVNVSHDGLVHLQHTPHQGQQEHIFQSTNLRFPYRQWITLEVELDFSSEGYAKAWLDGTLASHAHVRDVQNQLAQAHFGLYAAPSLASGEIRNDDLSIVAGRCR